MQEVYWLARYFRETRKPARAIMPFIEKGGTVLFFFDSILGSTTVKGSDSERTHKQSVALSLSLLY